MKNQISTSLKLIVPIAIGILFSPDTSGLFTQAKAQIGCVADWQSNSATNSCTVYFTNKSTGATNTSWNWTFGDGQTSNAYSPSHTYSVSGTYNVCLTIFCGNYSDTACKTVTVQCGSSGSCAADWQVKSQSYCTVNFNNTSTGTNPNTTYTWNFGDGQTSNLQNPAPHTYSASGTYNVCLVIAVNNGTVGGMCYDTLCKTVTVQCGSTGSCVANWVGQSGTAICTFYFTNTSTGTNASTTYNWTFGDGQTSTQQSPSHTYSASGTYSVCLTITVPSPASGACTNTLCKTVQCGNTGIEENTISVTSVFPNPSNNMLEVSLSGFVKGELKITDITGREVYQEKINANNVRVNVSALPVGYYTLSIASGAKTMREKIMIAR